MDVLVALGTTASYGYSALSVAVACADPALPATYFFESPALLITFVLLGRSARPGPARTGTARPANRAQRPCISGPCAPRRSPHAGQPLPARARARGRPGC